MTLLDSYKQVCIGKPNSYNERRNITENLSGEYKIGRPRSRCLNMEDFRNSWASNWMNEVRTEGKWKRIIYKTDLLGQAVYK